MVMCGMIAQYNEAPGADAAGAPPGPNLGPVVRKRLRIQGFIVSDTGWPRYGAIPRRDGGLDPRRPAALARGRGRRAARMRPRAFIGLLKGENFGKLVVRVD